MTALLLDKVVIYPFYFNETLPSLHEDSFSGGMNQSSSSAKQQLKLQHGLAAIEVKGLVMVNNRFVLAWKMVYSFPLE